MKERWERTAKFLNFKDILLEDRLNQRPDLCAFLYLDRKFPGNMRIVDAADHDEIWLGISYDEIKSLTDEDILYLSRCGVRYDDEHMSLLMYV